VVCERCERRGECYLLVALGTVGFRLLAEEELRCLHFGIGSVKQVASASQPASRYATPLRA
jgi:hypothetical protein